jgi:hypothetical protein
MQFVSYFRIFRILQGLGELENYWRLDEDTRMPLGHDALSARHPRYLEWGWNAVY